MAAPVCIKRNKTYLNCMTVESTAGEMEDLPVILCMLALGLVALECFQKRKEQKAKTVSETRRALLLLFHQKIIFHFIVS